MIWIFSTKRKIKTYHILTNINISNENQRILRLVSVVFYTYWWCSNSIFTCDNKESAFFNILSVRRDRKIHKFNRVYACVWVYMHILHMITWENRYAKKLTWEGGNIIRGYFGHWILYLSLQKDVSQLMPRIYKNHAQANFYKIFLNGNM